MPALSQAMPFDLYDRVARAVRSGFPWLRKETPALDGKTEFDRRMLIDPRPLVHPDARFIVLFSPKAACTNVVIWFFHHLGHLKAARDFNRWPHQYRQKCYYPSELYRNVCELDLTKNFKVVRVVRDPYERAASSYRHAVRSRTADAEIAKLIDYRRGPNDGLSFDQFLDFLERRDLTVGDPHFRIQRHPVEDMLKIDYLINITKDNLFERLAAIETELGLGPSAEAIAPWLDRLKKHNRPQQELTGVPNLTAVRLTQEQGRKGPWPSPAALLTPRARERIKALYAADIAAYLRPGL